MGLLDLRNISMSYGKLQAVSDLTLSVEEGQIHGLIGPNGAGKTTAFNLITGFCRPTGGDIVFGGESIGGLGPHVIAGKGIARSFQQTLLFKRQSVLENVLAGCHMRHDAGVLSEFLHTRKSRRAYERSVEEAGEILRVMDLEGQRDELAGNLPHGHQKALGVCMALACRPRLLLLDEPVTGMNPTETKAMAARILAIRRLGHTIILVEHSMEVVSGICDWVTVMSYGSKIAEGRYEEIRRDGRVIEAYLGSEEWADASGD